MSEAMETIEMVIYLIIARALTRARSPQGALNASAALSGWFHRADRRGGEALWRRAEQLAHRASRLVRGDCYDRAVGARWWLAKRGVRSDVVLGVRRGASWEGHAWLEGAEGQSVLIEPGAGYREVGRG